MFKFILIILLFCLSLGALSQEDERDLEEMVESIVEDFSTEKLTEQIHLQKIPPDHLKKQLLDSKAGDFFEKFPMALNIVTDIIEDERAMNSLVEIQTSKELRETFYLRFAMLIGIGFLFKFFWKQPQNLAKRFMRRLVIGVIMFDLSLVMIYFTYGKQLGPTIAIIWHHLGPKLFS
jgi:hypothetical protein